MLGLRPEELTTVWAVLASILQLGNICFSSSEVGSPCALDPWWLVCIIRAAIVMPNTCMWEAAKPWASFRASQPPWRAGRPPLCR